jgi:hypothetical protein
MESIAYQDRFTTLQNELNNECANAEGLETIAEEVGAAPGQRPLVQPASIPDPESFNGSRDKL